MRIRGEEGEALSRFPSHVEIIHLTQDERIGYLATDFRLAGERRRLRRKKPTLADFGLRVTISMAAFSQRDRCMIMVADTMLSYQDAVPASEDATDKIFPLEDGWFVLFAGSPSPMNNLFQRIRWNRLIGGLAPAVDEAEQLARLKSACRDAYQAERSHAVTDKHLSVYGMKLEDFRRDGYQAFGPQVFAELSREIRDFSLDTDLLICGFDRKGFAHIFQISDPGEVIDHDLIGYAAIGSGAQMAMGVLSSRTIRRLSWRELAYRLCEAKFTSETATGVGRSTSVLITSFTGIGEYLRPVHVEQLRDIWEQQRATPAPAAALEIVEKAIKNPNDPPVS